MPLWEYKHITSGPHGFATPALLESHLNQLGKDEWEIIHFQTLPTNPLAFNGVARRSTLRDWTLETAAAAAAKAEADKLRAEFAAKFAGAGTEPAAAPGDDKPATLAPDAGDDGLRRLRDTERDDDPEALADEAAGDDWANLDSSEDDLPNFFEAIKPHLRRNQRGPGQSVAIDYLSKRWEQPEADLISALQECGFILPENEDAPPDYLEFEGDLYWLNANNRGQFFLNTREKPRPVFRTVQAKKLDPADPVAIALADEAAAEQAARVRQAEERAARQAEQDARRAEANAKREAAAVERQAVQAARAAQPAGAAETAPSDSSAASAAASTVGPAADPASPPEPLPVGEDLLAKIRPMMRRNRRGPGYSGSSSYLARALRHTEADLIAAFAAQGLHAPEKAGDKPVFVEIGAYVYWLNKDGRDGVWINGQERRTGGEQKPEAEGAMPEAGGQMPEGRGQTPDSSGQQPENGAAAAPSPASQIQNQNSKIENLPPASPLSAVRLLLTPNKRGSGVSGEVSHLARTLGKSPDELLNTLLGAGLTLPAGDDAKPTFVEHEGEIFWFNENPKDESLWLNAKASRKSKAGAGARSRKSEADE